MAVADQAVAPHGVIDMHAHCIVPEVAPLAAGLWPSGKVDPKAALGPHRLEWLDGRGIDLQVLSINKFWWYGANEDTARAITRVHDEALADWCAAWPARFVALSSVALQFPELAAEQLETAVTEFGLRGAAIGGHVGGEVPSTPRFDPFWAMAEALEVPVFMHPSGADFLVREGALGGVGNLRNIVGNPLETTVFLLRLIFDGTFDRFPRLKICAAHGGGYLPSYLGRSQAATDVGRTGGALNLRPPADYLRRQVMVDSLVFSAEGLRHLVAELGPGQVAYGTDLPHRWPDTLELIREADFLSGADKRAILGGNLERWLGFSALA